MTSKIRVCYVTTNIHKHEENAEFVRQATLSNGQAVRDLFEFELRPVAVNELLEVDLRVLVQAEVVSAYSQIKVPCVVEHAGLIFEDYRTKSYPGGLTKPMWNTLDTNFVKETQSAHRRAIARAVVAYCDGKGVHTFVGDVAGQIADAPRGSRKFYWDTVFIPDGHAGKTYAEIVEDSSLGLQAKVRISQSSKAMLQFLEFRLTNSPDLWSSSS